MADFPCGALLPVYSLVDNDEKTVWMVANIESLTSFSAKHVVLSRITANFPPTEVLFINFSLIFNH